MVVTAVTVGVQSVAGVDGEGLEEVLNEVGGELADGGGGPGGVEDGIRPSTNIQRHKTQGFIHRHIGMTDAIDPFAVTQCLVKRFAKDDGCIFNGVMAVNMQIAFCLDFKIEKAVDGYGR
jgi:hypothetical protein